MDLMKEMEATREKKKEYEKLIGEYEEDTILSPPSKRINKGTAVRIRTLHSFSSSISPLSLHRPHQRWLQKWPSQSYLCA